MAEAKGFGQSAQDKLIIMLLLALVAGALLLGYFYGQLTALKGGTGLGSGSANPTAQAPTGQAAPEVPTGPLSDELWAAVQTGVAATKGDANAPVTIVEFLDYRCGFCGRHAEETYPEIIKNYVDTGQVKYMVRALPFLGPESDNAAQAALCAADQGGDETYFAYHDLLFENVSTLSNQVYKDLAADLGLNASQFGQCLDDGKYVDKVQEDMALAMQVGANGTPTFFINGNIMIGAQPYSAFETAIEAEL